jgi:hypothetical protein
MGKLHIDCPLCKKGFWYHQSEEDQQTDHTLWCPNCGELLSWVAAKQSAQRIDVNEIPQPSSVSNRGRMAHDDLWLLMLAEKNGLRITDKEDIRDLERLRDHLRNTAYQFEQLIGDFSAFNSEQRWANSTIDVLFTQANDESEMSIEVGYSSGSGAWIIFAINESNVSNNGIDVMADAASGSVEEIIELSDMLIKEWPSCHQIR